MSKIYSYSWALHVYLDFCKSYSRANKLLQEWTHMTEFQAIWMLRNSQEKWEKYKKSVKILENFLSSPKWAESSLNPKFKDFYLTYVEREGCYKPKKNKEKRFSTLDTSQNELLY